MIVICLALAQDRTETILWLDSSWHCQAQTQTVDQYLPQRGHSYLRNDRDFVAVERKMSSEDGIYLQLPTKQEHSL